LANVLAYQEGEDLKAEFLRIMAEDYSATQLPLDFARDADNAMERLNAWIAENTKGRIPDFLSSDEFTADIQIVLANALTFDAKWDREFDPADTRETPFFPEDGREVSVPMMKRKGVFRLSAPADGVQILRLPYRGGQVEMVLVLPAVGEKLRTVERALSARQLLQWIDQCQSEPSEVYLPRFTGRTSSHLRTVLSQLGMPCAFDSACADLSGITSHNYPLVWVKHGCYVEVDEEGTKAAAVTATGPGGGSGDEFRADRPFLYFIRETTTGAILLMGRVTNPMELET
jgi:serpin B